MNPKEMIQMNFTKQKQTHKEKFMVASGIRMVEGWLGKLGSTCTNCSIYDG